jgi:hypothetical protein
MAPTEEELMRYALDGEPPSDEAQEHLTSCPTCMQRAALYTGANIFLTSSLYRSQCPSPSTLANYCTPISYNLLSSDTRMQVAEHIAVCPLCSTEVATLRHDLASTDLFPERESVGRATVHTFSAPATVRRLVATLQTQRPQLVTRSSTNEAGGNTASDASWPKHYKADTLDVSLHLSRGSNGDIMLLGLFTSTDPDQDIGAFEGCVVDLYTYPIAREEHAQQNGRVARPQQSTQVDDLGNIVFKAVPVGVYTMLVHLPDIKLIIEGINIDHT